MSFRRNHPILFGLLIVAGIFLLFGSGLVFVVSMLLNGQDQPDIFSKKDSVGVIELKGLIVSPEKTIKALSDFRKNQNIKSVILRINSPGGAVGASQEIFTEVERTNAVKPVVASMESLATSGGYYAALGAEKIIANPGTLTGSIGVIVKFPNLEKLFGKIGYESEIIKSGRMKDIGAPNRAMTEAERALMQDLIDNVHRQFVGAISAKRSIPVEKVTALADGRVFSGEQAKELGLIDDFGNFTDAVILAARLGGLETDDPPLIYAREKKISLLSLIIDNMSQSVIDNLFQNLPVLSYEWTAGR